MSDPLKADNVIEARGLLKLYGSTRAVDPIDLSIARGEIFGLLGPNGAGKTTTILMMLGLTETSGGTVEVLGFDPVRVAVERNLEVVPRSTLGEVKVQDGDEYEIVRFVGGG